MTLKEIRELVREVYDTADVDIVVDETGDGVIEVEGHIIVSFESLHELAEFVGEITDG